MHDGDIVKKHDGTTEAVTVIPEVLAAIVVVCMNGRGDLAGLGAEPTVAGPQSIDALG